MQNKIEEAIVSFENPENKSKIIMGFKDNGESVDFNIDYENVDEDTETGLNGRLAMLFLEFCNSLNNEGKD